MEYNIFGEVIEMIINTSNINLITERKISIHDYIFLKMEFNYIKEKLAVDILDDNMNEVPHTIEFCNIIGFEMQHCNFWGKSPHILDWEIAEENEETMIPKLFYEKQKNNYDSSNLIDGEKYIESIITFTSGDKLIVACSYIVFL